MDGTLLHWDETVGAATVAELQRWRADGVPFVLATGRPPRWMRDIREVIGWGTAVCCNGAVLLDLERFEVLDEDLLQPDVLAEISTELRHRQPDTWFAVEYGMEFRHEPIYRPRWDIDAPGVAPATLDEMVQAPVAKLLARHEHLARDRFVARHGVGPEDVVVFGDMPNDIAAFEWVRDGGGRAVAMEHAHPDLLAVATDVTGTNDDDGVAAFLAAL